MSSFEETVRNRLDRIDKELDRLRGINNAVPTITVSDTAPTIPAYKHIWFDTSSGLIKYWDGFAWQTIS